MTLLGDADHPLFADFQRLVRTTPALRAYGHRMWMRHQAALAQVIAAEIGAPDDDVRCAAPARFALEARDVIFDRPGRERAADEVFGLLEHGWAAVQQSWPVIACVWSRVWFGAPIRFTWVNKGHECDSRLAKVFRATATVS
ncbi:hypothetical protein [Lentzea sp. E54]|uniref:hypothetical protein n=1 Tax=Lentzea xerophila TaxID=3435883 RepID=UPI003DA4D70B